MDYFERSLVGDVALPYVVDQKVNITHSICTVYPCGSDGSYYNSRQYQFSEQLYYLILSTVTISEIYELYPVLAKVVFYPLYFFIPAYCLLKAPELFQKHNQPGNLPILRATSASPRSTTLKLPLLSSPLTRNRSTRLTGQCFLKYSSLLTHLVGNSLTLQILLYCTLLFG